MQHSLEYKVSNKLYNFFTAIVDTDGTFCAETGHFGPDPDPADPGFKNTVWES